MRILLLSGDVWNDNTNGNNIYSNWFNGYNADFANIYLGQGQPKNNCCNLYFQVTDKMMLRSLWGAKAGKAFFLKLSKESSSIDNKFMHNICVEQEDKALYTKLKSFAGEPLRLAREILWSIGKYDKQALKEFIDEFNPDIIFCTHLFSLKYRRIERIIHSMTNAPMIAFTGDAEASLQNINYNPLFWLRQTTLHFLYPSHIKLFKQYLTFSESQCNEISTKYGIPAEPLYKCVDIQPYKIKKTNDVIKLVYAGRLYCNRWKTISALGDAIEQLNKNNIKAEIYIYSQDLLNKRQMNTLLNKKCIHFKGSTHPSNLSSIYQEADIALHVESFSRKYKYATMHSFSTKIIDLMSSTCAIMAICWNKNNGWKYLKKNNAAICISDYKEILPTMQRIIENPSIITEYAKKAYECGIKNHSRKNTHDQITNIFTKIINENKQ